jgi:hypothetical protein
METKGKVVLVAAMVFLVAGLLIATGVVDVRNVPALYAVLPMGVILLGMFLVLRMFEKESRIAVEDQKRALAKAGKQESGHSL